MSERARGHLPNTTRERGFCDFLRSSPQPRGQAQVAYQEQPGTSAASRRRASGARALSLASSVRMSPDGGSVISLGSPAVAIETAKAFSRGVVMRRSQASGTACCGARARTHGALSLASFSALLPGRPVRRAVHGPVREQPPQ